MPWYTEPFCCMPRQFPSALTFASGIPWLQKMNYSLTAQLKGMAGFSKSMNYVCSWEEEADNYAGFPILASVPVDSELRESYCNPEKDSVTRNTKAKPQPWALGTVKVTENKQVGFCVPVWVTRNVKKYPTVIKYWKVHILILHIKKWLSFNNFNKQFIHEHDFYTGCIL
jgi:hypothetical protein